MIWAYSLHCHCPCEEMHRMFGACLSKPAKLSCTPRCTTTTAGLLCPQTRWLVLAAASSSRTPVPLNTVNTPTFILTSIKTFHNPFVRRAATPPPASGDVCRWTVSMSPPEAALFTSWITLKYPEILYCLCLTWKSTSTNLVEKILKNYRSCFIYAQYH